MEDGNDVLMNAVKFPVTPNICEILKDVFAFGFDENKYYKQ